MSLFDTLKYPISVPPKMHELESLPVDLFKSWVDHYACSWSTVTEETRHDSVWVSEWLSAHWGSESIDHTANVTDIELLRKLINEYESF